MQDNNGAAARLHNVLLLVVYRYGLLSSCRDNKEAKACGLLALSVVPMKVGRT